jgi:hypothetical protein
MTRRTGDQRGVAAVEFAIVTSLLLFLAFGALPLYAMLRGYQKTAKASAATLRYATSVSSNTSDHGGTLSRRPSYDEIATFARDAADDPALAVLVTVCRDATCTDIDESTSTHASPIPARAGDTVKLTVRTTVDLSVLGRVANAVSRLSGNGPQFPENDVTMTSTASAREE